jgi:hypothetical protein
MNRRKFLGSTLKAISSVSCAPFCTKALHAPVPQQSPSVPPRSSNVPRPQLAITMDDPRLKLESSLRWCNKPGFFPSSKAIFSRLNSGSRMVIARAHRVAA